MRVFHKIKFLIYNFIIREIYKMDNYNSLWAFLSEFSPSKLTSLSEEKKKRLKMPSKKLY